MPDAASLPAGFLTTYGSLIIATIALAQPWVMFLWNRYVKRGYVEVLPAGNLEIGFSAFGPTVGLLGVLRSHQRDVFVNEMRLRVTRISDHAERILKWRAVRSNEMTIGGPTQVQITFASGTPVRMDAPFKYNILFSQDSFLADQKTLAQQLVQRWHAFVRDAIQGLDAAVRNQLLAGAQNPVVAEMLFVQFCATDPGVSELQGALAREFYWSAGEYELELTVDVGRPTPRLVQRWKFNLDANEVTNLANNRDLCIRDVCGLTTQYNFANPAYLRGQTIGAR
jgi:hypothetical protein